MSAWCCFEYRLVLWCSSFLGYVNCCSLPSESLSIAYCLTLQRPTANCSLLANAVACPSGRAQPCCVLVDVSCSLYAFNHRGSEARRGRWMLCGLCPSQQQPWHPHCLPMGVGEDGGTPPPPTAGAALVGDVGLPTRSSRCSKFVKMGVSVPQNIARKFFLLFVKDNVIIIIPWKRKKKRRHLSIFKKMFFFFFPVGINGSIHPKGRVLGVCFYSEGVLVNCGAINKGLIFTWPLLQLQHKGHLGPIPCSISQSRGLLPPLVSFC